MIPFITLISQISYGQKTPAPQDTASDNIILIDHFGKLIEDREGREPIKWISQGLQLRIGSSFIYADSAVIFGEDRVNAYGDVVIQQGDSLHVFTDTLRYFKDRDLAQLIGEVVLEQGSRQLWTTHLDYFLGDRYGEYRNGGVLIDKSLQVSSRRGIYWAAREEVKFVDSVIVLHPKFNLAADSMRYLAAQSLVKFTGPTNIYTAASKIYCEGGFYDLNTETAEFNKNPQYKGNGKDATADTIRYKSLQGEIEMLGNVNIKQSDGIIIGSYLKYLENTGETWIKGNPALYKDSIRTVSSPEIFYNERTNQLKTIGPSEIRDGAQIIKADESSYNEETGLGELIGNVHWRDTVKQIGIQANKIDYSKQTEYILAYGGRPIFYSIIEEDTLYISADTLNRWNIIDTLTSDTIRRIRAYHDVRMFKSNMQGIADSLVFLESDSLFTFYGDPVMWSDTTQFSADTIM
ncbi:MAG TPA: OstA-like protein, partial [Saprospiraceae bacterium]|nr:OstA-like protein [Saprospiraceae bacterium]